METGEKTKKLKTLTCSGRKYVFEKHIGENGVSLLIYEIGFGERRKRVQQLHLWKEEVIGDYQPLLL